VAVPTGPSGGYTIEQISGDGQTAEFGQELPLQLMVRVLRAGYPVANVQVTWTADSGGGFIYTYPNTGLTDSNGRATIKWYMGPKEGRQLATASVEGGGSVQFEATGVRAAYGGEVNSIQFNPGMTWLEPGMSSSLYGVALKDSKAARWAVLSWTIDNPDVLSVRIEPTGVSWSRVYFTGLKVGEATFTATSGSITRSITIKVFPPSTLGGNNGGRRQRDPDPAVGRELRLEENHHRENAEETARRRETLLRFLPFPLRLCVKPQFGSCRTVGYQAADQTRTRPPMRYRYHTLDVFTDRLFGGNPLAVFTDARGISDAQMQAVARELNLSETVFVFPPEAGGTRRARIFTPGSELRFAGHPTVGRRSCWWRSARCRRRRARRRWCWRRAWGRCRCA
jgi:hypothetical protein